MVSDSEALTGQKRSLPDDTELPPQDNPQKRPRRDWSDAKAPGATKDGRAKGRKSRSERRAFNGPNDNRNRETETRQPQAKVEEADGETAEAGENGSLEPRKPKKKVAVLLGYAGTGYKGMQMTRDEKTIEGDLFAALCAAGAIAKVNADDPKKSSFVRCARTDKGVHAAGNVVSLKMIIEDPDIVSKINEALPPQIRVWGFIPTLGNFSCYTQCDSRVYEYLIPSYCLLPPNPRSDFSKRLRNAAEETEELEGYLERQAGNEDFWQKLEANELEPALKTFDEDVREVLLKQDEPEERETQDIPLPPEPTHGVNLGTALDPSTYLSTRIKIARTQIRNLTVAAKRRTRISPERLARLRDILSAFTGTKRFHNYTVRIPSTDPSSVRTIKTFTASEPFLIDDTEWLSLKVHGQSFMMHQIRKMVAMAVLCVRCGTEGEALIEATTQKRGVVIPVPKAPALGLLLERPVFETYSERAVEQHGREAVGFDKFQAQIDEFKRKEIYQRIYDDEGKSATFDAFFGYIDGYQAEEFGYLCSGGLKQRGRKIAESVDEDAVPRAQPPSTVRAAASDDEEEPADS